MNNTNEEEKKLLKNSKDLETQNLNSTLDNFLGKVGFTSFHFRLIFISLMILYVEGLEMVIINFQMKSITKELKLTRLQRSLLSSSVFLGFFLGSIFSSFISNKYGRKPTITYSIIPLLIATAGSSFCGSFYSLFIVRTFVGILLGLIVAALLCVITEIIKPRYRALVTNLVWVLYPIGILYLAFFALNFVSFEGVDWRRLSLLNSLNPIPIFVLSFFLPESPRFLIRTKLYNVAWIVLNGVKKDVKLSEREKLKIIEENEDGKEENSCDFNFCLKTLFNEENKFQSLIIFSLWLLTNVIIFTLLYFLPIILKLYDFKNREKNFNDIMAIIFILFPAPMLRGVLSEFKKTGRKKLMFISLFLCLIFTSISIFNREKLLFFVCCIKFFVSLSNGIIATYTFELYSPNIRNIALGIGYSIARLGAIISPLLSELFELINIIGSFYLVIFCCIACMVLSFILPVETTTEKDLDEIYNKKDDNFLAKIERNLI